jgi:hypothetical protein
LNDLFENDSGASNLITYAATQADISDLKLSTKGDATSADTPEEYTKESIEKFAKCLLKILNDNVLFHERIIVVCNDEKLAALVAITIINIRQAQIESSINVNMATQTVLAKFPVFPNIVMPSERTFEQNGWPNPTEQDTFFSKILDYVRIECFNFVIIYQILIKFNSIQFYFKPEYYFLHKVTTIISEVLTSAKRDRDQSGNLMYNESSEI